jgi:hypothetical protein
MLVRDDVSIEQEGFLLSNSKSALGLDDQELLISARSSSGEAVVYL